MSVQPLGPTWSPNIRVHERAQDAPIRVPSPGRLCCRPGVLVQEVLLPAWHASVRLLGCPPGLLREHRLSSLLCQPEMQVQPQHGLFEPPSPQALAEPDVVRPSVPVVLLGYWHDGLHPLHAATGPLRFGFEHASPRFGSHPVRCCSHGFALEQI